MQKLNKSYIILATFFLLHLLCWVLGADLSHTQLRYDMAENYAWGQEMQLGYYKHPPLFAWVSYVWLSIFGKTHFAYFLLSQVNIIVAMVFIFLFLRKFVQFQKGFRRPSQCEFHQMKQVGFAMLFVGNFYFEHKVAVEFSASHSLCVQQLGKC